VVIGITSVSAFMANVTIEDLALVSMFAVLGMFMKAYAWPRPPILIAIVLTSQLEKWMSIAIQTRGLSMLWQPAFIAIIVFVTFAVFMSLRVQSGTQRVAEKTEEEIGSQTIIGSSAKPPAAT
jgi:TctA family transporter